MFGYITIIYRLFKEVKNNDISLLYSLNLVPLDFPPKVGHQAYPLPSAEATGIATWSVSYSLRFKETIDI